MYGKSLSSGLVDLSPLGFALAALISVVGDASVLEFKLQVFFGSNLVSLLY